MDRKFLELIDDQDSEVSAEIRRYRRRVLEELKKRTRGNELTDTEEFLLAVGVFSAGLALALARILKKYSARAVVTALETSSRDIIRILVKSDLTASEIVKINRITRTAEANIQKILLNRKFPGTKETVSDRLKTLAAGSTATVRNIVFDAQNRGEGAFAIARRIDAYVAPTPTGIRVAPWTMARRVLGRPVSYIPRGIPAGSVNYNAMRIARTETAFTYQQAPYNQYKDLWYVTGFKWILSRAHPKEDLCDEYAAHEEGLGKGVWKKPPRIPHPHCLCRAPAVVLDEQRFLEGLRRRRNRV